MRSLDDVGAFEGRQSYDGETNSWECNNACGNGVGGEFETLSFSSGNSGDHCWGNIQWGAIDSKSQCHFDNHNSHTSYNSGQYERMFALFKEKEGYEW